MDALREQKARDVDGQVLPQKKRKSVLLHFLVKWGSFRLLKILPAREESVEGARLEAIPAEDVRADLRTLLHQAHGDFIPLLGLQLFQLDGEGFGDRLSHPQRELLRA